MSREESSPAPSSGPSGLASLAGGVFRTVAAIAAVICCSRLYLYMMRSGVLDSRPVPSVSELGKLLYAGPAILTAIVKLAVGLLIIGSCGWGLALLVRWAAASLRREQDA
jgi:hypothetical protein